MRIRLLSIAIALLVTPSLAAVGYAQSGHDHSAKARTTNTNTGAMNDARSDLREAQKVVKQLNRDPDLKPLLDRAKGVFLIPDYGRGAIGVGGSGGEGVVLARIGHSWSDPAFYNFGSISAGLQAGATAGQLAMVLMTQKALDSFMGQNNFSIDAKAGLDIVKWSPRAQGSIGHPDIVLWADTEGLFAGASFGLRDIVADSGENAAYYGRTDVTPSTILSGKVNHRTAESAALKDALSPQPTATTGTKQKGSKHE